MDACAAPLPVDDYSMPPAAVAALLGMYAPDVRAVSANDSESNEAARASAEFFAHLRSSLPSELLQTVLTAPQVGGAPNPACNRTGY
eukprot:4350271-Pyramimonas_sp.AAC.1